MRQTQSHYKSCIQITDPTQVRAGDIMFFYDPKNISTDVDKQISHVALCVGYTSQNVPLIAHATYNPTRTRCKVITSPLRDPYSYIVFRPNEPDVAAKAAAIANDWATKHFIHYDFKRLEIMEEFLDAHETIDEALQTSQATYDETGFWRALKYAIRVTKPFKDGSARGFRCDQFVITCLQVAKLCLMNQSGNPNKPKLFYDLPSLQKKLQASWISLQRCDKRFTRQLERQETNANSLLRGRLQEHVGLFPIIPLKNSKTTLLPFALSPDFYFRDLGDLETAPLGIDAKKCTPAVFFLKCLLTDGGSGGDGQGFTLTGVITQKPMGVVPEANIIPSRAIRLRVSPDHDTEYRVLPRGQDKFMSEAVARLFASLQRLERLARKRKQAEPDSTEHEDLSRTVRAEVAEHFGFLAKRARARHHAPEDRSTVKIQARASR